MQQGSGSSSDRGSSRVEAAPQPGYPFSAIVGQDQLRLSLILCAVHPGIGGVLVRGEKGTAKSTVVRALAALLPAVEDDNFIASFNKAVNYVWA